MKKLNITGFGHQIIYNEDLMHLSEGLQEIANALAGIYGNSCYLQSGTATIPHFSSTHLVCNAGAMIYKGEICLYDAQDVPPGIGPYQYVWEPVTTYRACDPLTYADSSSHSPHIIKKVRLAKYISLPGDYVLVDNMLTIGQAIATIGQGGWTDITLLNGWATTTRAQYRKDADGTVYLRGSVDAMAASSNLFATIPGIASADDVFAPCGVQGSGVEISVINVQGISGNIYGTRSLATGTQFMLNGISYTV